ncbi:hypothetical protein DICPUDRAFT_95946 [Dictyostelium purpureum]|uniref:SEC7 domain-containing protein n=1 Tax=Dictyostelium purpureum TaxID=5786 RepID=F1A2W7_DICPU|nr:uncharacterized protein DICPUDRAFT_95946 [Dictyostelium purpureum]EGC29468.1 hypothetical protein DICPUDRAFT_95946 [Dictyostelium purpureum]|eukprot:XP_003294011.1 hypothetical protein DICPUDRAFT_95946 [Dictyostelium purpureum]
MTDTSIHIENLSVQEKVMIHIEDVSSDINEEENSNNEKSVEEEEQINNYEDSNNNNNSNVDNNSDKQGGQDISTTTTTTTTTTTVTKVKPPMPPIENKPTYLSSQKPQVEASWSDLKSKMNQMDKSDLKRGSILIEHLSEYNKLASSQVILGEEEVQPSSPHQTENNHNKNNSSNNSKNNIPEINEPIPIISSTMSQDAIDSLVMAGVNLFNEKPKKGVDYFIQNKFLEKTPESVAEFLHECPLLNKKSIGDYLGDIDPFCISTLESLISRFNFKDLDFDMSLRQLLYSFRLPGEAQKIDRIVQRFANQYYKDNVHIGFADPDTVYTLAFAIILLNTDSHNPVVKPTMTKPKFVKSLSKINGGKDLPSEFLEDIYDRILVDEIKMNPSGTLFPYAVKKGWLNIRVKGKVTDKWSRKWCVLSDGTLYFFRKPTDSSPVRYLRPDTVITSKKEIKGKKNCFILNHSSPPITLETLLKSSQKNGANGNSFNPQALLQQLAQFGKEQKKEIHFWDSAVDRFGSDNHRIDILQEVLDTDSVSSLDTLSETSSATNYFEDELSPSSSVSSTSPMSYDQNYDPTKKGYLRSKNGKDMDVEGKLKNLGNGTQTLHRPPPTKHTNYNPNFNTMHQTSTNSTLPPSPSPSNTATVSNGAAVNHSLTQPRPNYFKTVSSSSLIRSSSISTFSTPNSVSSNSNSLNSSSSSVTSNNTTTTPNSINSPSSGIASSASSTPNSVSSTSSSSSRPHTPQHKSEKDKQYEKNLESFLKLQEKMIKASKNTNTCIINADSQREMNSWIRLITSKK